MMKLSIIHSSVACLWGLLLLATASHAARLDTLFQAEVNAAGRGAAAREAALGRALQDVLVRVTGSAESASQSRAQSLLKQPGRFVEQFRFLELPGRLPGQPPQLRLWVQFDGVALSREIRQAGLPYWGPERPDVLAWLAIDDRGRRYLVSETGESSAAGTLMRAARHRGLPLTLPLMDLEDQRAVQFTDVWGGFVGTVNEASQRYRSCWASWAVREAVVTGERNGPCWGPAAIRAGARTRAISQRPLSRASPRRVAGWLAGMRWSPPMKACARWRSRVFRDLRTTPGWRNIWPH